MKKRSDSMKLVEVAGERPFISAKRDYDKTSEEQDSDKTSEEQDSDKTSEEQDNISTGQTSASTSAEQVCASTSVEQAFASESNEQVFSSTPEVQTVIFSEQPGVLKLKRLFIDFPRLTLPAYVNFGNLLAIAERYVEFRNIIRIIFLLNRALPFLNRTEQKKVVTAVVKVEEYISELAQYPDTPYDPKEIDELFCHLGCRLDYITSILQKTRVLRYSCFLVFGFDVYPSQNRRNLVLREKNEDVDENFLRRIGTTQTYLRTRLDTKYLNEISRDHPEFGPSIKTALNVYAAMKYLTYERQVKVFKSLYDLQETLKELVLYKRYLNVYCFEKYVPSLIGKVAHSFSELLEYLRKQIVPPPANYMRSCEPCETVSKFVRNANVKPDQLRIRPANPRGMFSYANVGIAQGHFRNLESLFHHLAAIKGAAFMHTPLYKSRIDWLEIARQYKEYKTKARQDLDQLGIWKDYMFWRLVEAEEVMAEARTFCDRIRGICFTGNETLSDSIALGGELELLTSEADDYLTSIQELIEDFVKDWPNGVTVNRRLRSSRFLFLTKIQWDAFNFPY